VHHPAGEDELAFLHHVGADQQRVEAELFDVVVEGDEVIAVRDECAEHRQILAVEALSVDDRHVAPGVLRPGAVAQLQA
jgi:hypothetical protein